MDDSTSSRQENEDYNKEIDSFYDALDEFPFYESPSSSFIHQNHDSSRPSFVSPTGPRLRRRSFSHRFREKTSTTSGNDSDPKSSLTFSYASSKDRKKRFIPKVEKLVPEDESLDLPGCQISSNLVSNNSVNSEINDNVVDDSEDPNINSFVEFNYVASEERRERYGKILDKMVDDNDDCKEFPINLNTEIRDNLPGCSGDNFDLLSGEISPGFVTNSVNTEIKYSNTNPLVGFDYAACEERKERFAKKLEELETRKKKSNLQNEHSLGEENQEILAANCANDDELVINESSSGFLFLLAGLVIKAIGLQLSLLVTIVTFPIRFLYCTYMFVVDPFQVARRGTEYARSRLFKIIGFVCEKFASFAGEWMKEHKTIWQLVLRFGWGFLWATYVCVVLISLLISAFVFSGFLMRKLVDEPIQMKEVLTFDYTKNSPVAFVPISSCPVELRDVSFVGKSDAVNTRSARVIPHNHKLQATISLVLPESDYNRKLGIFQVRVDLLSAEGRTLARLRHPCMLHFKSQPIRMLLTFFRVAPLVTGYSSESQTLNVKLRGFTEGDIPTACIRVMIEQRAEFHPGAGIPEIYDATFTLESQLPLLKKLMWLWKKTLFIWFGLSMFTMQLMFALVFCKHLILPRGSVRDVDGSNIAP